jgi:hypothetical protein
MTFLALVFDIGTPEVQFSKTIIQIFALFFYTNDGMDENGIDGCLGVNNSFSRFVDDLLTVLAGEESGYQLVGGRFIQLYLLGNDVMPLGSVGIFTRLESSLELRKDVYQDFC